MKKLIALFLGLLITPASAGTVIVVPTPTKVCPSHCKPGHCVKHPKRRAQCAALCSATVSAACNAPRIIVAGPPVVVGPPVIIKRPRVFTIPRPHPHRWGGRHRHR